jgi:hypothetical protein
MEGDIHRATHTATMRSSTASLIDQGLFNIDDRLRSIDAHAERIEQGLQNTAIRQ